MRHWRWVWGLLCLFIAPWVLFQAPAKCFWYVAVGATEWCYMGVLISSVPLFSPGPHRRASTSIAIIACLIFLTPLVRAWPIAHHLPTECSAHFGWQPPSEGPGAPVRQTPLSLLDLIRGIPSPPVQVKTYVYSQAPGPMLALDLYAPKGQHPRLPGIIVVHGGSWASGERNQLPALNRYLAARGYLVAAIDYRLAPRWRFPAACDDVFRAIAYLKEHANDLGLDTSRLTLLGRSAGGEIALTVAYSGRDPAIRGVIAFYAPSDLEFAYMHPSNPLVLNSKKVLEEYLGGSPNQQPLRYQAASPLDAVGLKTPPTLLIHGGRDELVWSVHSDRLAQRLEKEGIPHFFLRLPWATHGCDANLQGPSGQLSTYTIERFLSFVTK